MERRREKTEKDGTKDVLTTWEMHAANRYEIWGESSSMSKRVNDRLSIASCLKLLTSQKEEGTTILSPKGLFVRDRAGNLVRLLRRRLVHEVQKFCLEAFVQIRNHL